MSQDFPLSFPLSDILGEDLEQELFQHVGSQDMNAILNTDLSGELGNGTNNIYPNGQNIHDESTTSMEDVKTFYVASEIIPQLLPIEARKILSNEEYLGPYSFDVSVVPNYTSKNPWVYSTQLTKVFMDMNQPFPINFRVSGRPNKQLFIRTTPQYCAQHDAGDPVCRCIMHEYHGDSTNKDIPPHVRKHVIRCTNKFAQYVGDTTQNERLSIVFPLSVPQVGNESVKELFHFVCKSSCPLPSMNRRAIEIIFTLEDVYGEVFGRKCLKVRICSCPKRDKDKEENDTKDKANNGTHKGKKRKAEHPLPPSHGKVMSQSDDFKEYALALNITGTQNLLKILTYAEDVYMGKAYQLQGQPEEHLMRKNLAEIQDVRKKLQSPLAGTSAS